MSNYAIYKPKNKAAEYSAWACNFYVGCSNGCEYCYLKKGRGAAILGGNKPQLKKCFKHETHAFNTFIAELLKNKIELKKHGIFFSFTTDPLLPETKTLTWWAAGYAINQGVPVKILTKCTAWVDAFLKLDIEPDEKVLYAFGFTLTGHDELEPNANTNTERIEAIRKLHFAGFKTWASIEPIIDFESSYKMILESFIHCDLYKIGLESGKKYSKLELVDFVRNVIRLCEFNKVYFKDSILKAAGINRADLPENCVSRDYNMFEL